METPKDRILTIIERLGMSGVKAAEVMKITDNTFRKNKMESVITHNFSERNYNDLIDFLIDEVKFLISFKQTHLTISDALAKGLKEVDYLFKNYNKFKEENPEWNLFDNLKLVVDSFEIPASFEENMNVYSRLIDEIESHCNYIDDPNIFTIEKYNEYAQSDKTKSHNKWFEFMAYRRMNTINEILK